VITCEWHGYFGDEPCPTCSPKITPCHDCLELAKVLIEASWATQPKDGYIRSDRNALRTRLDAFIKARS
jgi:hypothetical protein